MKLKQWQAVLNEQKVPHQLKLQTHQIENVFAKHNQDTQVNGGNVTSKTIRFDLSEQVEAGKEMLSGIKKELLSILGVSAIHFSRREGALQLQIERQEQNPVSLVELITEMDDVPQQTAILGLDDEGYPLLHEFTAVHPAHMLIQGESGAGKSTLLRTIGVSLAMLNKQSQLQLIAISLNESSRKVLSPLNYLPHLLEPLVNSVTDCQELFSFLEDEMSYRLSQTTTTPTIVVLVDDVEEMLSKNTAVVQLQNLLQNGPNAGIHFVLSHDTDSVTPLPEMIKANIPLKVVGWISDAEKAQQVTGVVDSQAELLNGKGEFLTFFGDSLYAFHVANVNEYDLHLIIDRLHRSRPRPMLAQSFVAEAPEAYSTAVSNPQANEEKSFTIQEDRVTFTAPTPEPQQATEIVEEVKNEDEDDRPETETAVLVEEQDPIIDDEDVSPLAQQETQRDSLPQNELMVEKPIIKFAPKVRRLASSSDAQEEIPFDLGAPPDKL